MRRVTSVAFVAAGVLVLGGTAALANDPPPDIEARENQDEFDIEGNLESGGGSQADEGDPVPVATGPSGPPPGPRDVIYEPNWGTHPETGDPCITLTRFVQRNVANSHLAIDFEHRLLTMLGDQRLADVEHNFCSDVEGEQNTISPAAVAQAFVRTLGIPTPEPRIDPGWALTGMPAYLEIGGQDGFVHEEQIPAFGTLRVEFAPSAFVVNWGDGTETYIEDGRTGAPHDGPESQQISHTYTNTSPGNVVQVEARWHARWSLAGFSGSVGALQTSAEFPLEVREMQTVRTSR